MRTARPPLLVLIAALALVATVPAAAEWLQAQTEHFRFVFEPRDRASVDELLSFCEDVYAQVTGFFRSYPRMVEVVVRGRLDYANGLTAPFPSRLELILTAPSWPWLGSRGESWLRGLLIHELTHYVHLTLARGVFDALSYLFGPDARWGTSLFLPGWMIEGPATNTETIFTSGGRGRNPFFESLYRAPTMEGRLFSLAQAGFSSALPPSGRIYVAGYVLVSYLLDTFGEDTFTLIMDDYVRFPFFGPWAAIERVTGRSGDEVYAAMRARLQERYRSAAAIAGGRTVTPDRVGSWYHPMATARGLYVFHVDPEHFPAVVSLDIATGAESILVSAALSDEASFTATRDGGTVCWAGLDIDWREPDGETAVSDLWIRDVATGATRRLTTAAHLRQPALSADGARLVAVQGTGPYSRLVSVDLGTGAMRVLLSAVEAAVSSPTISPDGSAIAFTFNQRGYQDVYVMSLAPAERASVPLGDPRAPLGEVNRDLPHPVLGPDPAGEYFPSWNVDGGLLFSSDRSGSLALYLAEFDEATATPGQVTLVQEDPVAAYEGILDADGLLYASYSSKGWCLKRAALPDAASRQAVSPEAPSSYPPAAAWTGRAIEARPYADVVKPYLWMPVLSMGGGLITAIDIGVGATFGAASLLGTSALSASYQWHPLSSAQEASLAYSFALGPVRVDTGLAGGYAYDPGVPDLYLMDAQASLDATLPLWARSVGDERSSVSLSAGVVSVAQLAFLQPFSIVDALLAPPSDWLNAILLRASGSVRWKRGGGAFDFYPPWFLGLSLGGLLLTPAFGIVSGERYTLFAEIDVPSPVRHHVLRAGLKATYTFDGLASAAEGFAVPRGAFALPLHSLPGRALVSLDYLAPIALLDQPLVAGIALLGVAAGLHVEATADWGFGPAASEAGRFLYAGVELTLLVATAGPTQPLTAGAVVRFDAFDGWRVDPARDIGWYLAFSFDSFAQAGPGSSPLAARTRR